VQYYLLFSQAETKAIKCAHLFDNTLHTETLVLTVLIASKHWRQNYTQYSLKQSQWLSVVQNSISSMSSSQAFCPFGLSCHLTVAQKQKIFLRNMP